MTTVSMSTVMFLESAMVRRRHEATVMRGRTSMVLDDGGVVDSTVVLFDQRTMVFHVLEVLSSSTTEEDADSNKDARGADDQCDEAATIVVVVGATIVVIIVRI